MLWVPGFVTNNSKCARLHVCEVLFLLHVSTFDPPGYPAVDSVVVLEEGSGLSAAQPTATWVDSDEFGPVNSNPIYMSTDKSTKTPPSGTLSRVGTRCKGGIVKQTDREKGQSA